MHGSQRQARRAEYIEIGVIFYVSLAGANFSFDGHLACGQ